MTTTDVLPLPLEDSKARTDSVVVELLMPATTSCVSCLDALQEVDDAAALLAQELAARGTALRVRVATPYDPAASARPLPELRVNGVAIEPRDTHECDDGGATACGTYEWDGATYAAPPAEQLTALVHDHLDHLDHKDPS